MKIWRLRFEIDKYDSLIPSEMWSLERIHSFDGRSQTANWTPIDVVRAEDKKELELSDAPFFYSHIPIFNKIAKEILEQYCKDAVEFLEATNGERQFWIVNVVNVLDCIEYEKSQYKVFPGGKRIMRFKKYSFKSERVFGENIFKIKDMPLAAPFVSDEFKRVVEENNLTGFNFELVWDSEENN